MSEAARRGRSSDSNPYADIDTFMAPDRRNFRALLAAANGSRARGYGTGYWEIFKKIICGCAARHPRVAYRLLRGLL